MSNIAVLKQHVFDLMESSRQQLFSGQVDLTLVEESVRAYCEALAAMPREEARPHIPDLQALSEAMNQLEKELKSAQLQVKAQLAELGTHQKAHTAYKKSDAIGEKFFAPEGPEDGV